MPERVIPQAATKGVERLCCVRVKKKDEPGRLVLCMVSKPVGSVIDAVKRRDPLSA